MKRYDQINAFTIKTNRRNYIVTLERLTNTINGAPRWKAVIICPEKNAKDFYNAVYTFTGHYYNAYGEAEFIVNEYEKSIKE